MRWTACEARCMRRRAARRPVFGTRGSNFDAPWGMRCGACDATFDVRCATRLSALVQEVGNRNNARRAMRDDKCTTRGVRHTMLGAGCATLAALSPTPNSPLYRSGSLNLHYFSKSNKLHVLLGETTPDKHQGPDAPRAHRNNK